jgi:hypothetical protein
VKVGVFSDAGGFPARSNVRKLIAGGWRLGEGIGLPRLITSCQEADLADVRADLESCFLGIAH